MANAGPNKWITIVSSTAKTSTAQMLKQLKDGRLA